VVINGLIDCFSITVAIFVTSYRVTISLKKINKKVLFNRLVFSWASVDYFLQKKTEMNVIFFINLIKRLRLKEEEANFLNFKRKTTIFEKSFSGK
jgi:hypothetical protein